MTARKKALSPQELFNSLKFAQKKGKVAKEYQGNRFRFTDGLISIQPTSGYMFSDPTNKKGKIYSEEASDYKWSYLTFMFQDSTGANKSINLSPKIFMEACSVGFIGIEAAQAFTKFCEKYPSLVEI